MSAELNSHRRKWPLFVFCVLNLGISTGALLIAMRHGCDTARAPDDSTLITPDQQRSNVTLHTYEDGEPAIFMHDGNGDLRVALQSHGLYFYNESGVTTVRLSANDLDVGLSLRCPKDRGTDEDPRNLVLNVNEFGDATLVLAPKGTTAFARMDAWSDGTSELWLGLGEEGSRRQIQLSVSEKEVRLKSDDPVRGQSWQSTR